jgi:hypothetical protein
VISDFLAEGGMGAIFRGKRAGPGGFEKEVVLKQLLPEFASDPEITKLFLREARLSATLDHQNIVHTLDLLQVAGSYYIVMEYVRGADLRTLLRRTRRRGGRFSPAAALLVGRALLDALDYAHRKALPDGTPLGLIHRDISPSNILLSAAGEVKLTDFGIAKAVTHTSTRYQVRGKVGYMSPEQARGEPLDARSDLFSLAVVLYEVLCGQRLFVGDLTQSPAVIYAGPIAPPSQHRSDLPPELDRVMARALSLTRDDRFQSALEFQVALSQLAQRHGLLLGHAELAAQLRELCGPDPVAWLRDEDRTGTAQIGADELLGDDSDVEPLEALAGDGDSGPHEPPGDDLLAAGGLRVGETTSLMWVKQGGGPGGAPDTTQPMARQPPVHLGIAAMARKMVRGDATKRSDLAEGPEGDGAPRRGDDTRSVSGRPAETRRLPLVLDGDPALLPRRGKGGAERAIQLSVRAAVALIVVAVLLLGLGVLLGLLLSAGPDGGEGGRCSQGAPLALYCGPPTARREEARHDCPRPQRHERSGRVTGVHPAEAGWCLPRHQGA